MVAIDFNLLGYIYQEGIDRLAEGYTAAVLALQAIVQERKLKLLSYQAAVAAGKPRIGKWDEEEGYCLWEQDQIFEMEIENAESSLADLRKAYMIAIYHHWERSALRWVGRQKENHEKLVAKTRTLGYPIDSRIDHLRDLVNTLKHNNAKWGERLNRSWPSVVGHHRPDRAVNWYDVVVLDDASLFTACEIIRQSGPKASSMS